MTLFNVSWPGVLLFASTSLGRYPVALEKLVNLLGMRQLMPFAWPTPAEDDQGIRKEVSRYSEKNLDLGHRCADDTLRFFGFGVS